MTHIAMEGTGIYWKSVYNILEGYFDIALANAQRIKNVPGRKTDVSDAEWIAKLLRVGLIEKSLCTALCEAVWAATKSKNPCWRYSESGKKTDRKDAVWIAQLLRCGLIEASFVPRFTRVGDERCCTDLEKEIIALEAEIEDLLSPYQKEKSNYWVHKIKQLGYKVELQESVYVV